VKGLRQENRYRGEGRAKNLRRGLWQKKKNKAFHREDRKKRIRAVQRRKNREETAEKDQASGKGGKTEGEGRATSKRTQTLVDKRRRSFRKREQPSSKPRGERKEIGGYEEKSRGNGCSKLPGKSW